jgi:AcrR family transcriptional regulator
MQEPIAKPAEKNATSGRGRPKDPHLESKVYAAAIKLYSDVGWGGFNFEQIAKAAGVGKAALYSRWGTREELLVATFETRWAALSTIETGTMEGDIRALAEFAMLRYTTSNIILNMQADGRRYEEFRSMATPFSRRTTDSVRAIIARWIDADDQSASEETELLMNVIMGTITSRVARIDMQPMTHDQPEARKFIDRLVSFIIRAMTSAR